MGLALPKDVEHVAGCGDLNLRRQISVAEPDADSMLVGNTEV